jgi:UDP-glucose 4-epimerase
MRVLVTGDVGYNSSHAVVALHTAKHTVCVVDNFDNSSTEVLVRVAELVDGSFEHHRADIRNHVAVDSIMDSFRPDAVINFAGLKAVGESGRIPLHYYDVNITGTARSCNRRIAQVVRSSSAALYGESQYLPIDEAHPLEPANAYSRTNPDRLASNALGASAVFLCYFNSAEASAKHSLLTLWHP